MKNKKEIVFILLWSILNFFMLMNLALYSKDNKHYILLIIFVIGIVPLIVRICSDVETSNADESREDKE